MKIARLFLLAFAMIGVISCSNDDDPSPNIEQAKLSFAEQNAIVELPAALQTSEDPIAQSVNVWLTMVNNMATNFIYFDPPEGAQKTSNLITVSSGRTAARKGVVWIWTQGDMSVAYQVGEDDDKYTFEIFMKVEENADWAYLVYAEERKDRSAGFFALYDFFGGSGEEMRWAWTRKGDEVTFKITSQGELMVEVSANNKTKSGVLTTYMDGSKYQEITWTGSGSGTWKIYNEEGIVVEEDTWEA
jgi:hypothetical protein